MPERIYSQLLGELTQDQEFDDWWHSPPVAIPFFDGLLLPVIITDISAADTEFIDQADACLREFWTKHTSDRLAASELVFHNAHEFCEAVGEPLGIDDPTDIWQQVHPTRVVISWRPYGDKDVYLTVECECDWEVEHGLQLVFRRGRMLTRVSQYDGHLTEADAYGLPDERDKLLSAYNTTFAS
ncbi:DUF6985 domain-containing protein [Solirubrum puertoriconensis]|uniref:DUF6985 domain-containing protein n=1 Tax=Solirubrum puertoriconensis TaxID=1751427 RepID=A0A9X0L4M2_SOLP1|nr:hypothetical protein [Solirubrum puertoriconensis]KUG07765.1 hypothetical protein ASU33_15740 [Solirubrum puertoriconensis]